MNYKGRSVGIVIWLINGKIFMNISEHISFSGKDSTCKEMDVQCCMYTYVGMILSSIS